MSFDRVSPIALIGVVALLLGLGFGGGYWYAHSIRPPARTDDDRERADRLTLELAQLQAQVETSSRALASAELRADVAEAEVHRTAAATISAVVEVRRPTTPAVRARAVTVLVNASEGDVIFLATSTGRPGFWVAEPVLIELQAARTASVGWAAERGALQASVNAERAAKLAAISEAAALAAVVARWREAHDADVIALESARAQAPPVFWRDPRTWLSVGLAAGVGVLGGLAAAR